jgi:hypothetical protein
MDEEFVSVSVIILKGVKVFRDSKRDGQGKGIIAD